MFEFVSLYLVLILSLKANGICNPYVWPWNGLNCTCMTCSKALKQSTEVVVELWFRLDLDLKVLL